MIIDPPSVDGMGAKKANPPALLPNYIDTLCALVGRKFEDDFGAVRGEVRKSGWQTRAADAIGISQSKVSELWGHYEGGARVITKGLRVETLILLQRWGGWTFEEMLGLPARQEDRATLGREVSDELARKYGLVGGTPAPVTVIRKKGK